MRKGIKITFITLVSLLGLLVAGIGIVLKIIVDQKAKNAKKFRKGEEYGSARWGAYYQL